MGSSQHEATRGILKQVSSTGKKSGKPMKHSDEETGSSSEKRRVRFALQELGRRDHEKPRRMADEHNPGVDKDAA